MGNKLITKSKEFKEESEFKVMAINSIAKLKKFLKILEDIFNNSNGNFGGGFINLVDPTNYNSGYNNTFTSFTKGNIDIFKLLKDVKIKDIPLSDLNTYDNNDEYKDIII